LLPPYAVSPDVRVYDGLDRSDSFRSAGDGSLGVGRMPFAAYDLPDKTGGMGDGMLLERERERLLEILNSRTSTHEERKRARRTLEGELSPSDWPGGFPGARNNSRSSASRPAEPATPPNAKRR
jgi:hypothetical protein